MNNVPDQRFQDVSRSRQALIEIEAYSTNRLVFSRSQAHNFKTDEQASKLCSKFVGLPLLDSRHCLGGRLIARAEGQEDQEMPILIGCVL